MTPMDWRAAQNRQTLAGRQADEIVDALGLQSFPIDPLAVAESEGRLLRARGANFGNQFDGMLEYHAKQNRFLLFYNTKYDSGYAPGTHHPRTRFSIGHELGHYFTDRHRAYLLGGRQPHPSRSEFRNDTQIEREADAFAASLLLPTRLFSPFVNAKEISASRIVQFATDFQTSIVSTAIRAVGLSHFPCAIVGIREGSLAWMFPSDSLIEHGIYPIGRGPLHSPLAQERWGRFCAGDIGGHSADGRVRNWFQIFRDEFDELYLTEEYIAAPVLNTLLVLLTMDERDLGSDEDDEPESEDE